MVEADPFLKVTPSPSLGEEEHAGCTAVQHDPRSSISFLAEGSHLLLVWWLPGSSGVEGKNLANLTIQRGTDTAHLKQLFVFYSVVFSLTPKCLHGIDELLCCYCNYVLELFLQPLFLSTMSLSEYSEAILF